MAPQPVSPNEFSLIKKELEELGESLGHERLDRIAEVDQLRLEVEAMRKTLEQLVASFGEKYWAEYDEVIRKSPSQKKRAG